MARLVELIETHATTGKGTEEDPVRRVFELWTKDGKPIAWHDEYTHKSGYDPIET